MGEEAMVTQDLAEGARLVSYLDATGSPITAAILAHDASLDLWRLVLAVPRSSPQSRMALYEQAQAAISALGLSLSLSRVTRIFDTEPLVGTIRALADAGFSDVVEIPLGGVDLAGAAVDRGYAYRMSAIRYEEAVFSALQRVQPADAVLRRADALPFLSGFDFDFVLDNGTRAVVVEAKSFKQPLTAKDVQRISVESGDITRYYPHAPLMIAAESGFTQEARDWISGYSPQPTQPRTIIPVKWGSADDDQELSSALSSAMS